MIIYICGFADRKELFVLPSQSAFDGTNLTSVTISACKHNNMTCTEAENNVGNGGRKYF
jgi:hypothetical protein